MRRRQIVVSVEVVLSHDGETRKVSAWFWHGSHLTKISYFVSSFGSRACVEVWCSSYVAAREMTWRLVSSWRPTTTWREILPPRRYLVHSQRMCSVEKPLMGTYRQINSVHLKVENQASSLNSMITVVSSARRTTSLDWSREWRNFAQPIKIDELFQMKIEKKAFRVSQEILILRIP